MIIKKLIKTLMIFCLALFLGLALVLVFCPKHPRPHHIAPATENEQFLFLQQRYEKRLEHTLTQLLEPLAGKGKVRVAVKLELDLKNAVVKHHTQAQDVLPEQANTRTTFVTSTEEKQIQNLIQKQHIGIAIDGTMSPDKIYQPRSQKEMEIYWKLVESTIGYNARRGDTLEIQNVPFTFSTSNQHGKKALLLLAVALSTIAFLLIFMALGDCKKSQTIQTKPKTTPFSTEKFNKILQNPERAANVFKNWIYLPVSPKDTDWTPLQKVSIVLLTAHENFVRQILIALDDDEVRKVSKAMATLGVIPPQESSRVLNELYEAMFVASTVIGNPVRAQQILTQNTAAAPSSEISNWQASHQALWQDLENIPSQNLAQKLDSLSAEVAAYLLYQLSTQKAAETIPYFSAQKTNQILIHLSHIGQIRATTNQKMEEAALLAARKILNTLHTPTGTEKTSEILAQLKNTETGEKIMDTLSLQEPSLAKKLAAQLIRFEDLSKWSSLSIRTLLKHTPRSVVVTALVDAPDDILRKIQGNIPEQIWLLLNQDIATQKSQTQTDQVAQARSKIVDIARTLLQQSKIDV